MVKHILFLCGHNAGRSQMAEAMFNNLNKNSEYHAISAGTNIVSEINQQCALVMKELGIDMIKRGEYYPKSITKEMIANSYRIYSMGCNVKCNMDLTITDDLDLEDPAGKSVETVRDIRDQLKIKIISLINNLK